MLKDPVLGKQLGFASMGSFLLAPPWAAARIELSTVSAVESSPLVRIAPALMLWNNVRLHLWPFLRAVR